LEESKAMDASDLTRRLKMRGRHNRELNFTKEVLVVQR